MSAPIDRQTACPFHLKLFYRTGGFHRLDDFPTSHSTAPLPPHLQIYTWPTCTLRELSHLLTTALPSLLPSPSIGTRLAYRLIYPDTRPPRPGIDPPTPRYMSKELGNVVLGDDNSDNGVLFPEGEEKEIVSGGVMAGGLKGEPERTLGEMRFVVGDFVDCAVFEPLGDGSVAPPPSLAMGGRSRGEYGGAPRGGGYGGRGPRENGYGRGRGGGGMRGGYAGGPREVGRLGEGVPSGEWRRGERIPDGRGYGGYGRGRGRGGY